MDRHYKDHLIVRGLQPIGGAGLGYISDEAVTSWTADFGGQRSIQLSWLNSQNSIG